MDRGESIKLRKLVDESRTLDLQWGIEGWQHGSTLPVGLPESCGHLQDVIVVHQQIQLIPCLLMGYWWRGLPRHTWQV